MTEQNSQPGPKAEVTPPPSSSSSSTPLSNSGSSHEVIDYSSFYPQDSKLTDITPDQTTKITNVLAATQALANYYLTHHTDYGTTDNTNKIATIIPFLKDHDPRGYFSKNKDARQNIAEQFLKEFQKLEKSQGTETVVSAIKLVNMSLSPEVNGQRRGDFFPLLNNNQPLSPEQTLAATRILPDLFRIMDTASLYCSTEFSGVYKKIVTEPYENLTGPGGTTLESKDSGSAPQNQNSAELQNRLEAKNNHQAISDTVYVFQVLDRAYKDSLSPGGIQKLISAIDSPGGDEYFPKNPTLGDGRGEERGRIALLFLREFQKMDSRAEGFEGVAKIKSGISNIMSNLRLTRSRSGPQWILPSSSLNHEAHAFSDDQLYDLWNGLGLGCLTLDRVNRKQNGCDFVNALYNAFYRKNMPESALTPVNMFEPAPTPSCSFWKPVLGVAVVVGGGGLGTGLYFAIKHGQSNNWEGMKHTWDAISDGFSAHAKVIIGATGGSVAIAALLLLYLWYRFGKDADKGLNAPVATQSTVPTGDKEKLASDEKLTGAETKVVKVVREELKRAGNVPLLQPKEWKNAEKIDFKMIESDPSRLDKIQKHITDTVYVFQVFDHFLFKNKYPGEEISALIKEIKDGHSFVIPIPKNFPQPPRAGIALLFLEELQRIEPIVSKNGVKECVNYIGDCLRDVRQGQPPLTELYPNDPRCGKTYETADLADAELALRLGCEKLDSYYNANFSNALNLALYGKPKPAPEVPSETTRSSTLTS